MINSVLTFIVSLRCGLFGFYGQYALKIPDLCFYVAPSAQIAIQFFLGNAHQLESNPSEYHPNGLSH